MRKMIVLIIFVLAFMAWCGSALASDSGTCGELTWNLDAEGVLTISGYGEMKNFDDLSRDAWRPDRSDIRKVIIESGITNVGSYAFGQCSNLESVTLPNTVTCIGSSAFSGCGSLDDILLPDSLVSIESGAFGGCSSLSDITIPDGVNTIGSRAFAACISLTNIVIPEGVTQIEPTLFGGCSSLTDITMPNALVSIGSAAFKNCSSLKSIAIPDTVTKIESSAFSGCSSLTDIELPKSITSINYETFKDCNSLKTIIIPDGVTSIGWGAFSDCNAKRIANLDTAASVCLSEAGFSFRRPGDCYDLRYLFTDGEITGLEISNVDQDITEISIPDDVTSIGDNAFYGCSKLAGITIPDGVTNIGGAAFYGCSKLAGITIPNGVTSIPYLSFMECRSLSSVVLPDSISSIGSYAFSCCDRLKGISIPDGVTCIEDWTFEGCGNLNSITIPESVTSIDDHAFEACYSLKKVVIPGREITFGDNVFNSNPTIYCYAGSDADEWAQGEELAVEYLDEKELSDLREIALEENFRLALGDVYQVGDNVFPAYDHPVISWLSSHPSIVTVDNGTVVGKSVGTSVITASCDDATAGVEITVYVPADDFSLSPNEIWLVEGTQGFAVGVSRISPADAEVDLTWVSSDTSIATVDNNGAVELIMPGDVTITANSERGISRSACLHICYPVSGVELAAPRNQLLKDDELQLTANVTMNTQSCENHLVTFSSSNETIACVDSKTGLVHGTGTGTVTITATADNGISDEMVIQVLDDCVDHFPEIIPAVSGTCTEPGLSEGTRCAICGEVLVQQQETEPLGHDWGRISYRWNGDNTQITASRKCNLDGSHTESETVDVSSEVTLPATCTEKGRTTYTSQSFKNATFSIQTKTLADVDALGHEWGEPDYVWEDDYSKVTATRICSRDEQHKETETALVSGQGIEPPTCTEKGKTIYLASPFRNKAFTPQRKVIEDVEALGHDWINSTYAWREGDTQAIATHYCSRDPEHVEVEIVEAIASSVNISPTTTEKGLVTRKALFIKASPYELEKTVEIPSLNEMKVLYLPEQTKQIEEEAFAETDCQAVIIPEGCLRIEARAFADCKSLQYVLIPGSIEFEAEDAFEGCPKAIVLDRK